MSRTGGVRAFLSGGGGGVPSKRRARGRDLGEGGIVEEARACAPPLRASGRPPECRKSRAETGTAGSAGREGEVGWSADDSSRGEKIILAPLLARRSRRRLHGPGRARGTGAQRRLSTHHGCDVHVVGVRGPVILFQVHVIDAHASLDFLRRDGLRRSLRSLALAGTRAAGAHAARRFVIVSRSLRLLALRRRHRGAFRWNLACRSLNATSGGNHNLFSCASKLWFFFRQLEALVRRRCATTGTTKGYCPPGRSLRARH